MTHRRVNSNVQDYSKSKVKKTCLKPASPSSKPGVKRQSVDHHTLAANYQQYLREINKAEHDSKLERFLKYTSDLAISKHVLSYRSARKPDMKDYKISFSPIRQFVVKPTTLNYFTGKKLSRPSSQCSRASNELHVRIGNVTQVFTYGEEPERKSAYSFLTPAASRSQSTSRLASSSRLDHSIQLNQSARLESTSRLFPTQRRTRE